MEKPDELRQPKPDQKKYDVAGRLLIEHFPAWGYETERGLTLGYEAHIESLDVLPGWHEPPRDRSWHFVDRAQGGECDGKLRAAAVEFNMVVPTGEDGLDPKTPATMVQKFKGVALGEAYIGAVADAAQSLVLPVVLANYPPDLEERRYLRSPVKVEYPILARIGDALLVDVHKTVCTV